MIPISDVRKRLVQRIDQAKRTAAEHRDRVALAERDYEQFLEAIAIPVLRMVQSVLTAEGYRFSISTPTGCVRLVREGAGDDAIEIELETNARTPVVIGRATFTRGRRVETVERPLGDAKAVADLGAEEVLAFVLSQIDPFVERG